MIWVNLLLVLVLVMRLGLIKDVDMLGLDATVAGAGGGGSQKKAESVVSAGERQSVTSTTAVKNNIPSDSQSDVLPCTSAQNEREDCTYKPTHPHRRRKQDC